MRLLIVLSVLCVISILCSVVSVVYALECGHMSMGFLSFMLIMVSLTFGTASANAAYNLDQHERSR